MKKYIDNTWDFRNENTKYYTHCMHNYPAMMIPQIAKRLIEKYGKNSKILFDPYCGTGTSLVEANLHNINAIGTDLNPLARLISKVKTKRLNIQTLDLFMKDFNDYAFQIRFQGNISRTSIVIPKFDNINFWFSENVIYLLSIIKDYIYKIDDTDISDFFKVAFSETIRETSFTKNSEFKLCRMPGKQRDNFNPDVFGIMISKLFRNRKGYIEYYNNTSDNIYSKILSTNTCENNFTNELAITDIDIIVTSPPYGDSQTTVAYGQFSRLSNQWLDIIKANQIDKKLMGGKRKNEYHKFDIKPLDETIEKIYEIDNKRAGDVISFYIDLEKSINNISMILKNKGYACYVVGNRKVKVNVLPTDEAIVQMFEKNNYRHVETVVRNIPSKRMPSKNSPTNIAGKLDTTMNQEYIVVMQKVA